ncbi:MAG: hypothetical protein DWQ51_14975 [Microcystis wesenbergii TW10]|uniref:Uncharacterized protein n=1 Tax=Microcystis wesenbergii TW10 TaxID=2060474 RepID=A0A3E0LTL1_9CHRO|nr:MAG: hypothetical protein DWQ51_14975 [Microcystis wesenbergii TW10]
MVKFYHGKDSNGKYWINLDHISFAKLEKDKLILKMLNEINVLIDGDDVIPLTQILWNETLNWDEEFKDNDKRYNHEDVPSREEVMQSEEIDYDWKRSEDEHSDLKDDDEDDDFFPPTGIRLEESEF